VLPLLVTLVLTAGHPHMWCPAAQASAGQALTRTQTQSARQQQQLHPLLTQAAGHRLLMSLLASPAPAGSSAVPQLLLP
jgi:hypothetical protein